MKLLLLGGLLAVVVLGIAILLPSSDSASSDYHRAVSGYLAFEASRSYSKELPSRQPPNTQQVDTPQDPVGWLAIIEEVAANNSYEDDIYECVNFSMDAQNALNSYNYTAFNNSVFITTNEEGFTPYHTATSWEFHSIIRVIQNGSPIYIEPQTAEVLKDIGNGFLVDSDDVVYTKGWWGYKLPSPNSTLFKEMINV